MSKVPMMRISLIACRSDEDVILNKLQDLGLVHVVPFSVEGFDPASLGQSDIVQTDIQALDEAIGILSNTPVLHYQPDRKRTLQVVAEDAIKISNELVEARKELEILDREIHQLRPWGQVSGADFTYLASHGVTVILSVLTVHDWELFHKPDWDYTVVSKDDEQVWVAFYCKPGQQPAVRMVQVPEGGLSKKLADRENLQAHIVDQQNHLGQMASFLPQLKRFRHTLDERAARADAQEKAMHDDVLFGVQGFIPAHSEISLKEGVSGYGAYLEIHLAKEEAETPILLRNNWFLSGFESLVSSFSGIDYREKDYTWSVGLLFIVFGSLCLLDAGYGFLLFLTGGLLMYKDQEAMGKVFAVAGLFATVFGVLCGSVFGYAMGTDFFEGSSPYLTLAQEPLEFFYFSLKVGLVVMGLSYLVAIWQRGFKTAATGSFLFVLTFAAMGLADQFNGAYHDPLISAAYTLAGLSICAWMVFPEKVFGESRVPNIIWTFYSGVTGLVQDILSHMRLFGIALSGAILALVVNQTAGMMQPALGIFFSIFAHLLVYLLALLSLYIHSNRLIFLEFGSKCIDGGHCYYKPLRRGFSQ